MHGWLTIVFLIGACAGGNGDRETLDAIPAAAASALRTQAGTSEVAVKRERAGGAEVYEGSWRSADGRAHEVTVTGGGEVVASEVEVAEASVPVAVRATAVRALRGAERIAYVRLGDGTYEAEAHVAGKEREVTIAADGRVVKGDAEKDDEDDDDDDGEEADD